MALMLGNIDAETIQLIVRCLSETNSALLPHHGADPHAGACHNYGCHWGLNLYTSSDLSTLRCWNTCRAIGDS